MVRLYRSLQPELNTPQISACLATVEIHAAMNSGISGKASYSVNARPQGNLAAKMPTTLYTESRLSTGGFRIAESGMGRGRLDNGVTLVASWFDGKDQKQQHITSREPVPRFGRRRDRPQAN